MSYSLEKLQSSLESKNFSTKQNLTVKKQNEIIENTQQLSNLERILNDKKMLEERKEQLMYEKLASSEAATAQSVSDVVFFIDRSGSCFGTEQYTIKYFNQFIKNEISKKHETYISVVLFNHESKEIYERVPIYNVSGLHYRAYDGTMLYDTVCNYLNKYKKITAKNGKKLAVIMTDGFDNSSTSYNLENTCEIINECKKLGWEFIFLGAKINSLEMASKLGIDYSSNMELDKIGIKAGFKAIERALDDLHTNGNIGSNWKKPLQDNYKTISGKSDGPILKLEVK